MKEIIARRSKTWIRTYGDSLLINGFGAASLFAICKRGGNMRNKRKINRETDEYKTRKYLINKMEMFFVFLLGTK